MVTRAALSLLIAVLVLLPLRAPASAEDGTPPNPAQVEAEKDYQEALEKALSIESSLLKTVRKVRTYSVSVLNKRVPRGKPLRRLPLVAS